MSIGEIQQLWARSDFKLDPAGTANPLGGNLFIGYGNGGVGSAFRNYGDPVFHIDVEQLYNYMNQSSFTWDYALHYVLHELMHVTLAGDEVANAGGIQATTANPVESWTSRMAQSLAGAIGLPYDPLFVPPGYTDSKGSPVWGPMGVATYIPPAPQGG